MWHIQNVHGSGNQRRATLTNGENWSTVTTDYQEADSLARKTLGSARLISRGYGITGTPTRVYVSQAY